MTIFLDVIEEFKNSINFPVSRVERLPSIILVFGGPFSVYPDQKYISCRNVFLDWMYSSNQSLASYLKIPEDFKEWNNFDGYQNLIEFEADAGCLSSCILLFSESSGSIAELGSFVMDETLCERLLVVVSEKHREGASYISLGPLKLIESEHPENSIFVSSSINPQEFEMELEALIDVLNNKFTSLPKSQNFNNNSTRDQLLLVADLVELFGALTKKEIKDLVEHIGISLTSSRVSQIINQLKLFELIMLPKKGAQHYFIAPENSKRQNYLNYVAKAGYPHFDRARFKFKAFDELKRDTTRARAYRQIHEAK